MSNENTQDLPVIDPHFNRHYIRIDEESNIIDNISLPKDTDPPAGAVFLHFGMTQPKLFADAGPEGENPALEEHAYGGKVYLYRCEGGRAVEKTAGEIAAEIEILRLASLPDVVRAERDALLSESDFTQLSDAPFSDEQREAWAEYRQALRDITGQPGFPEDVEWPAKPE